MGRFGVLAFVGLVAAGCSIDPCDVLPAGTPGCQEKQSSEPKYSGGCGGEKERCCDTSPYCQEGLACALPKRCERVGAIPDAAMVTQGFADDAIFAFPARPETTTVKEQDDRRGRL